MSKNTRGRRPNLPPAAYMAPGAATATPGSASSASVTTSKQSATGPRVIDWQGEYGDVMSDLRRTGLIALGLLAVLIALSFVL